MQQQNYEEFKNRMLAIDDTEKQVVLQTLPLHMIENELIKRYETMLNTLYVNVYGDKN